jgi:signal transduction histidine kinase
LETHNYRHDVQSAILEFFSTATDMPISLFERDGSAIRRLTPDYSREHFPPLCDVLMQDEDKRPLCEDDMTARARRVFETGQPDLSCCHAGLYNQMVPVLVDGAVRAVLSYGAVHLVGDIYRHRSYERLVDLGHRLDLPVVNVVAYREMQGHAPLYSLEEFERFKDVLNRITRLLYTFADHEEQSARSLDNVKHELQMRLQALLPAIENLLTKWPKLAADEQKERLQRIFGAAKGMRTVLHTLSEGQFMVQYRFKPVPLWPLVQLSRMIYEPEAQRRGIGIDVDMRHGMELVELSPEHMQIVVDNLIYNAVKYSFRSGPDRNRYVRVTDSFDKSWYTLHITNYGVGILPDEIESGTVFRDGYKGALTRQEYRSGSGKGLWFAQQIVDRHHGRIDIQSEPQTSDNAAETSPEHKPHLTRVNLTLPLVQPK